MALLHYFLLALLGASNAPATNSITELGTDAIVQPNGGVEQNSNSNSNSNSNTRIGGTGTTQNSNAIKKDPKKQGKKKGGKKKEDAPKKDS